MRVSPFAIQLLTRDCCILYRSYCAPVIAVVKNIMLGEMMILNDTNGSNLDASRGHHVDRQWDYIVSGPEV